MSHASLLARGMLVKRTSSMLAVSLLFYHARSFRETPLLLRGTVIPGPQDPVGLRTQQAEAPFAEHLPMQVMQDST